VVESLGRETLIYAAAPLLSTVDADGEAGYLAVHQAQQLPVREGQRVELGFSTAALHVFDSAGRTRRFPADFPQPHRSL
jgi:multiple sugar transport system ATP-binding protein